MSAQHTASDEDALIASCQAGHLQDFDPLYQRYVQPIFSFIYRRTLDRQLAEDITSTVFMKALEKISGFNARKGVFTAWLYGIARNTLTDHYRSHRPHTNIEDVWDLASSDDVSIDAEKRMMFDQVKTALATLDADKREVVLLRIWEGLSYAEIAAITGRSEASCKMSFSRTMAELRTRMPLSVFLLLLLPFSV